ncbi:leucine-rich repeat protein [Ruminococcus sp.]|uniref:leucine-rich repeat protein n=1 Tax=Ruminococcus sp. TaxID=41978 RepID=UPI0025DC6A7E|nr:leucine-rich repeat protein [Ruminococcus sp.]
MKTRSIKTRFLSFSVSLLMVPTLMPASGLQVYAEPENPDYLTFTAEEDNSSITVNLYMGSLQYSEDAKQWKNLASGANIELNKGKSVYLRGSNSKEIQLFDSSKHVEITGKVACGGNIMTLLDYENPDQAEIGDYCFYDMFYGCDGLTQAPELPSTSLADHCYCDMFNGCTGLTEAPALPATTLIDYCYTNMFEECTGLTAVPELPATTLADSCYSGMFYDCTSLTEAPALPATTLADNCYSDMFNGCTGLTEAPALPATILADWCYYEMFYGCTSLAKAPELPATILADSCYSDMFYGCTSLAKAPELPATILADSCYSDMFYDCTSLTEAPELPATTLADWCYSYMFNGCTSLTEAPELPATTLAERCYSGMFEICTGLTKVPALPATTLTYSCYSNMFYGCTGIKLSATKTEDYSVEYRVPASGEGTIDDDALTDMFMNTGGTFTGTPDINTTYYMKKSAEPIKLANGKYKQTANLDDKYYTRFVFVVPKSDFVGKSKAEFTAHYNGVDYRFETSTYYTGVTSNGITYTTKSKDSAIFVVTVASGSDISADLTCNLEFK